MALPATGSERPCVARSFLAVMELLMSVRIPIPVAWSSMLLLVDNRGLLAVVLRLFLVDGPTVGTTALGLWVPPSAIVRLLV
ncbi:uncharacterized protein F5891DRAFT_1051437, partial [Suillus fuscotomentosus]